MLRNGGEAGIRTLGTGFSPYNGLANRRLQPLGHLTVIDNWLYSQDFTRIPASACLVSVACWLHTADSRTSIAANLCGSTPSILMYEARVADTLLCRKIAWITTSPTPTRRGDAELVQVQGRAGVVNLRIASPAFALPGVRLGPCRGAIPDTP
jgi:hypothetical protein